WVSEARRQLGEAAATAAWARGLGESVARAVVRARALAQSASAEQARSKREPPRAGLTRREREAALLMARGLSNRQVAESLVISEGTAQIHAERILAKLGLRSRLQLADWACANDVVVDAPD